MRLILAFLVLMLGFAHDAASAPGDDLVIERASTIGMPDPLPTASVFMIITNNGATDDKLLSAKTSMAETVGLYNLTVDKKGQELTVPVPFVDIPAEKSTALTSAGVRITLMKLTAPIKLGETFPLTLVFEKAGEKQANVEVVPMKEIIQRFPTELMEKDLQRLRGLEAKTKGKEKQSWANRLRNKIRGLGNSGSTAEEPVAVRPDPLGPVPTASVIPPRPTPAPQMAPVTAPATTPAAAVPGPTPPVAPVAPSTPAPSAPENAGTTTKP